VTPLREGGSLPAIVEGDDLGTYVLKFRGAGQGPKVLIAELLAGEIGRALGLPVPEIVLADLDPVLGRSEPDYEIRELIYASGGTNLALDYLPGSSAFDPSVGPMPDAHLASRIVWFDALITNVDRTVRNTNVLVWHKRLWLIDNGAAFYFHYGGPDYLARAQNPFPEIRTHVLLRLATELEEADKELTQKLSDSVLSEILALVPDDWLVDSAFDGPAAQRQAYFEYLTARLKSEHNFAKEAANARP
jgi:hypothetical protein